MYDTCPTVRIAAENDQGFIIINEADFDQATHTLFVDPEVDDASDDDAIKAQKGDLIAQIISRGGDKPHHATGIAKLQDILDALPPVA